MHVFVGCETFFTLEFSKDFEKIQNYGIGYLLLLTGTLKPQARFLDRASPLSRDVVGHSQNHLAVARGYVVETFCFAKVSLRARHPTRYGEVVLTVSKYQAAFACKNC
jgi:hypothetical protein